jgi:hypothetical protein
MRKAMIFLVIVGLLAGSIAAFADDTKDPFIEKETAEKEQGEEVHHSVLYRRAMRDLDRAYTAGSLTRTEYIQKKREFQNIYE